MEMFPPISREEMFRSEECSQILKEADGMPAALNQSIECRFLKELDAWDQKGLPVWNILDGICSKKQCIQMVSELFGLPKEEQFGSIFESLKTGFWAGFDYSFDGKGRK